MRLSALLYASFTVGGILLFDQVNAQNPPAAPDERAMSEIRVTAPPAGYRLLRREDAAAIRGTYALSNGWILKVQPSSRRVFAEIDDRGLMELKALSPDKFVSLDGNMTMEFNMGDRGDEMLLAYVPDPRTAQVIMVRTRLAGR